MKKLFWSIICLSVLLVFLPFPVLAANPTVIIADYKVTPTVLQPGDIGTITATIKHTASIANVRENIQSSASEIITSTGHQCEYRECPAGIKGCGSRFRQL